MPSGKKLDVFGNGFWLHRSYQEMVDALTGFAYLTLNSSIVVYCAAFQRRRALAAKAINPGNRAGVGTAAAVFPLIVKSSRLVVKFVSGLLVPRTSSR